MRTYVYRRAGAVVIDGDHVLLVGLQSPGENRWYQIPGGGVEEGETPAEAACRELLEETGLHATSCDLYLQAGIHGGHHDYFLISCDDLTLGTTTGPEVDYARDWDFRAEWIPIADLHNLPLFPRCVAEQVAAIGNTVPENAPWVEDDRGSWDGLPGGQPPDNVRFSARVVVVDGGRVAAIERVRNGDRYFTLPGGGMESGETPADAAAREALEELGLAIKPHATLAVVVVPHQGRVNLQTYVWCERIGGVFGTGTGEEFTAERRAVRGTYRPVWLEHDDLPETLKPSWLRNRLPAWIAEPSPARADRFTEVHDD
ncbi:MAG: NUDIX domain-containing protein [Acidimicrobiales bacterium]